MLTLKSTLTRVPGNRAHVDLLFQKFDEDANIDFDSLDIAVNAVATAVKDFFFKVEDTASNFDQIKKEQFFKIVSTAPTTLATCRTYG